MLIDIFTGRGYLKGQGVLISATHSLGNKVICRYPGFTFQVKLFMAVDFVSLFIWQINLK